MEKPNNIILRQVEFLQGHHDGGGALPTLTEAETTLLKTLEDLVNLEVCKCFYVRQDNIYILSLSS
jgi:hypothetical protein